MTKKLVISFDDTARKEYVTGFRKRRQQRVKEAADKIALAEKNRLKEERAERRRDAKDADRAFAEKMREFQNFDAPTMDQDEYEDQFTHSAFGADSVVVTTTLGFPGEEEGQSESDKESVDEEFERLKMLRELAGPAKLERRKQLEEEARLQQKLKSTMRKPMKTNKKSAIKYAARMGSASGEDSIKGSKGAKGAKGVKGTKGGKQGSKHSKAGKSHPGSKGRN